MAGCIGRIDISGYVYLYHELQTVVSLCALASVLVGLAFASD
jgi:hypothetical protein